MKACGSTGEWEQTLKLFYEMQSIGIPPTEQCYTAAIRACAKADKVKMIHDLPPPPPLTPLPRPPTLKSLDCTVLAIQLVS